MRDVRELDLTNDALDFAIEGVKNLITNFNH
jgi:hypothetical protein